MSEGAGQPRGTCTASVLVAGEEGGVVALKFSVLASQFIRDRESVLKAVSWPVLVWESPPPQQDPHLRFKRYTMSNLRFQRPPPTDPLILELRKRTPESMEVTLGR